MTQHPGLRRPDEPGGDRPAVDAPVLVAASVDGLITHWSHGAEQAYGWLAEEVLGKPLGVLAASGPGHVFVERARLLAGEDVEPFEISLRTRSGEVVPVLAHLHLLRSADGTVTGTLARHRDLRPEREAQAALRWSEQLSRLGFDASPVPQSRCDLTGRVLAANAAMERLLGQGADVLVGSDALAKYDAAERPRLERLLARLGSGEVPFAQERLALRRADGAQVEVAMTMTAVPGPEATVLVTSLEDVTELALAQAGVQAAADRFAALLSALPATVFTYDERGTCTSAQGVALGLLGLDGQALVGTSLLELTAPRPHVRSALLDSLSGRTVSTSFVHEDRTYDVMVCPLADEAGGPPGGIGVAVDVTRRAAAEREVRAQEARQRALLTHAADVVVVLDATGRLVYISPAVRAHFGHDDLALFWRRGDERNHPDDRRAVAAAWRAVLADPEQPQTLSCRVRHADGTWRWTEQIMTNLLHEPDVDGVVVNIRDVTDQRRAAEELARQALHDGLTGLANRELLLDRGGQALVWGRRNEHTTGLVLLQVRNLQRINTTHGQEAGDSVLVQVANRLGGLVRETDTLARVGGARFAVLVEDVGSQEGLQSMAAVLAESLDAVDVDGSAVALELAVSTVTTPAENAGDLLSDGERALSLAAAGGAPDHRVLASTGAGPDAAAERLRQAVADGELRMHLQPVMHLSTGAVAGVEALVRWQHPERGLLGPETFLAVAERSGVVLEIGAWMLQQACEQGAAWVLEGLRHGIAVNLSARQMTDGALPDLVRDTLRRTGLPAGRLVVEVTESTLVDHPETAAVLQGLHDLGVRVALDDFGTGYSSLTYLRNLPVDVLKIDRSFVAGLGHDGDDEAIVASVVGLGRQTGTVVVAEGVETRRQLDRLVELGVQQGQGYLWAPALEPAAFASWRRGLVEGGPAPSPLTVRSAEPPRAQPHAQAPDADAVRVHALQARGASLHTIAAAMNSEGRRTATGARWTPTTVARCLAAGDPG